MSDKIDLTGKRVWIKNEDPNRVLRQEWLDVVRAYLELSEGFVKLEPELAKWGYAGPAKMLGNMMAIMGQDIIKNTTNVVELQRQLRADKDKPSAIDERLRGGN